MASTKITAPTAKDSQSQNVQTETASEQKQQSAQVKQLPVIVPAAKEQLPPLEDRLHRLNQLFDLQQKHTRLAGSSQKLNEFKMVKGEETVSLRIYDTNRNEFSTSNPDVIKEVLDFLRITIEKKRKEIEPLLNW